MQRLAAFDRHRVSQPVNYCAEGAQRELSMIACADRLRYRCMAFGQQSGEQQRSLDLGTGDWNQILDTVQPGAGNAQRRAAAFGRMNLGAHPGQGLNDSAHRPARERLVPDQFRPERLAGDDTRQHPHGRARIAAIEWRVGDPQLRTESVNHYGSLFVALDVAPQSANASESAGAIGARREVLQPRTSGSHGGKHGVAVRDGLVAWHSDTSQNIARGIYGD